MALINWEFFMNFPESAGLIENFLPEPDCVFIGIDLLAICGIPSTSPGNKLLVEAASPLQFFPGFESLLVLFSVAHSSENLRMPV
jgi:hypothetical protein